MSGRLRFLLAGTVALLVAARAAGLTIDNGSAPPDPSNVVDFATLDLVVTDCGSCPPPAPTTVAVVAGGSVVDLGVFDGSLVLLDGGSAVSTEVWDSATFRILAGIQAGDLDANGSSLVQITGGEIGGALNALDSATIEVFGSGFAVDGVPVGFGEVAAASGVLTGMLSSGDALDASFVRNGTLRLLPEPGGLALLGLGLGLGAARRWFATL